MHIKRCFYQDKKEMHLDTASILKEFESQPEMPLSHEETAASLDALDRILSTQRQFEQEHPKSESPQLRQQFEELAASALELAELYGLDICVKIDDQMIGRLTLCADSLLLRREYAFSFLPLIGRLTELCDEFFITPCQKDGEALFCMSFDVPLYVRA